MPRVRTPSPELTALDKQFTASAAIILRTVGARHRNEKLLLAAELADAFVDGPTPQTKPRVRKPKVAAAPEQPTLAHHSSV